MKVGGSLSRRPTALKRLCLRLSALASNYEFVIVPGGGSFADSVRMCYRVFRLSELAAHKMAILAMSQYGLLIADITPRAIPVYAIEECLVVHRKGFLPVLIPHRLLELKDPFPPSWDVTSDSISVYIARLLKAKKLILVKDVDGIYDGQGRLMKTVDLDWLRRNRSCLDSYFPEVAEGLAMRCYVVNGFKPQRVEEALRDIETICTEVLLS